MIELVGLAAAAGLGVTTLGVFHPRVPLFGPVIAKAKTQRRAIALTFDDGPHPEFTPRIAEILNQRGARGTFFCVGREVERHAAVVRSLSAAGHAVENHTYSHDTFTHLFSGAKLTEDLRRCQSAIESATGQAPRFYRPAVGIRNPAVHQAARAVGLPVVTWSRAPRDGRRSLDAARVDRLVRSARSGDIIALHDGTLSHDANLREATVEHLPALLAGLSHRGFEMVTLGELLL
ncbi:MAG: polysaccharide deacetylase family protein [Myxococcaceae bacterium]